MKYDWLKFPQVADVFEAAAALAKTDRSSVVTEWHLLLSLLRFDSVWRAFSAPEKLRMRLWDEASSSSDGKLLRGATPVWNAKFRGAILAAAERLRRASGVSLPQPLHFVAALHEFASAELREVMETHLCRLCSAAGIRPADIDGAGLGIAGVDTRRLPRTLRDGGSCRARLTAAETPVEEALERIRACPIPHDAVSRVSPSAPRTFPAARERFHVVAIDCGMKRNIVRCLNARGCRVTVVPWNTPADRIAALRRQIDDLKRQAENDKAAWQTREAELLKRIADLENTPGNAGMSRETLEKVEQQIKIL